ncbi:hypothetical protein [Streptomyces collinus]|uniref:hypothetical protein n=1 Tax=Streptomyces collinus TaxID=42684 RepID=UPI00367B5C24
MGCALFVVHAASRVGGRRVTVRDCGWDRVLGTAFSDHDLVVILEGAGVADAEAAVDDPAWVEWRDGRPHDFHAV